MVFEIEGFHGTDGALVNSILTHGMKDSVGDDHWLGDGSYFFIKGLSDSPSEQAKKWAIVNAWDGDLYRNKYCTYAVLKAIIKVEEDVFLDLTISEGVDIMNYIVKAYTEKFESDGKKTKLKYSDGSLINFARENLLRNIQVVKGNFYIKLTKEDRICRNGRRAANCTICSVLDATAHVFNLEQIDRGDFGNEIR